MTLCDSQAMHPPNRAEPNVTHAGQVLICTCNMTVMPIIIKSPTIVVMHSNTTNVTSFLVSLTLPSKCQIRQLAERIEQGEV